MEYADTDETRAMRERLERWNEFADLNLIDLFITDDQLDTLYDDALDEDVEEAAFYSDDKDKPSYVDFTRHRLHRVFNNGSFKEGGRFYGGWWIWVPSRYRNYIMINAAPTKEIDYSNLHAAMLYAREGLPLQEDAYSLDGVDDQYRKLIKTTFFKLINALEGQRIRPPRQDALPPDLSWRDLQDAIMEKHEPIAQHFQSGVGLELQRTDSDIAEDVMLTMMDRDILILPVHDSFITFTARENDLRELMANAYQRHMQGSIGMEADPGFLELEVPEETLEADQLGVLNLVDEIAELENREGFTGYRERKRAFIADKDEAWRWRFYPRS